MSNQGASSSAGVPSLHDDVVEIIMVYADKSVFASLRGLNRQYGHLGKKHQYETVILSPPLERAYEKMKFIREDDDLRRLVKNVEFVMVCDDGITKDIFVENNEIAKKAKDQKLEVSKRSVDKKWEDYKDRKSWHFDSRTAYQLLSGVSNLKGLENLQSIEFIGAQDTSWGGDFPISYNIKTHGMDDLKLTLNAIASLTLGQVATEKNKKALSKLNLPEFARSTFGSGMPDVPNHTPIEVQTVLATAWSENMTVLCLSTKCALEMSGLFEVLDELQAVTTLELQSWGIGTTRIMIQMIAGLSTNPNRLGLQRIERLRIMGRTQQPIVGGEAARLHPFRIYDGMPLSLLTDAVAGMSALKYLQVSHIGLIENEGDDQYEAHANFLDFMKILHLERELEFLFMDVPELDRFGRMSARKVLAEWVNDFVNGKRNDNPLNLHRGRELPEGFDQDIREENKYEVHMYCRRRYNKGNSDHGPNFQLDHDLDDRWGRLREHYVLDEPVQS